MVLFHFSAGVPVAKELNYALRDSGTAGKALKGCRNIPEHDVKTFDPSLSCLQPSSPLPCLLQPAVILKPQTAGPRLSAAENQQN